MLRRGLGWTMSYSLTYTMNSGGSRHNSDTAQLAIDAHAALLRAGAGGIVIRDTKNRVVTLSSVTLLARALTH